MAQEEGSKQAGEGGPGGVQGCMGLVCGESFVLQPREERASWVRTMHQGPHFSLLSTLGMQASGQGCLVLPTSI